MAKAGAAAELAARGAQGAGADGLIYGQLLRQARMLAFNDTFTVTRGPAALGARARLLHAAHRGAAAPGRRALSAARGGILRKPGGHAMHSDDTVHRALQEHLDRQAVGFPSVKSGADIRLLQRLFTPEEARLALLLTYRPAPTDRVVEDAAADWTAEQVQSLLERMLQKGAIGWKRRDGADHWYLHADGGRHLRVPGRRALARVPEGRRRLHADPGLRHVLPLGRSPPRCGPSRSTGASRSSTTSPRTTRRGRSCARRRAPSSRSPASAGRARRCGASPAPR